MGGTVDQIAAAAITQLIREKVDAAFDEYMSNTRWVKPLLRRNVLQVRDE